MLVIIVLTLFHILFTSTSLQQAQLRASLTVIVYLFLEHQMLLFMLQRIL